MSWKGIALRALAGLVLLALLFAGYGIYVARSHGFLRRPVFESERPALPDLKRPAVLVFSKTNSFIHREAIPAAKALLEELAAERGWSLFVSDSGGVFHPEDLARFDAMVWNNVTGDVLLPEQRQAMRAWLEAGGGYVGLHSAGDDSHGAWPWYQEQVIRARFIGHPFAPQFQRATLHVERPGDPIVAGLPRRWERVDEWYSFEASPRAPDLRVLLTIDEGTYTQLDHRQRDISMGPDHPLIWKHCVGEGRVLYSALGHTAESYAEPEVRQLLARAIAWAGRLGEPGAAAPDPLECELR